MQGQRRHADGINGEHEEARIVSEQLPGEIDQFGQIALQLPHFAIRAAAIFGRIENQAVIFGTAPHLAAQEFQRIIDHPAHRGIGQARQLGILAGGGDAFFAGVNVGHLCAGAGRDQAAHPGIAKHVHHPVARADMARQPIPLGAHVGEKTKMAERRVAGPEIHVAA